ncbi:MAG: GNAT family N-acetyltransferase, partial [Anaerolineaceae bacterium]
EVDGRVVACGKFTALPDFTAWLETLRVIPECQGMGIGKRFYERFFELAAEKHLSAMRMYTGLTNYASKGLAERYGFTLEETFAEARMPSQPEWAEVESGAFTPVSDPAVAQALLMPLAGAWNGFLVMNRTFYRITPALCADFARKGFVYADPSTGSVMVLGARFQPELALHIGLYAGNWPACLGFAQRLCAQRGAGRLNWMFPAALEQVKATASAGGFALDGSECIVMRVDLNN